MGASFVVRPLRAAIVFGLVAAGLTVAGPARASAAHCLPSWDAQPPNVGSGNNQLNGVAVTSACNAWAVGSEYRSQSHSVPERTLIEQWNGRAWKVDRSSSPGGANGSALSGVAAASSTDAWAVGDYSNGTGDQTLIEHWNGKRWGVQATPDPGGLANDNDLSAVAAASPDDVWAVGNYYDGTAFHALILHWNGKRWRVQPSARLRRPNGRFLHIRPTINLTGVAATSSKNAWAVGFHSNGTADQTLVEHWNGKRWRIQRSPNPGGSGNANDLSGIAATPSGSAWAVGDYVASTSAPEQTLVEQWNGRVWKMQTSPSPGGSGGTALYGVAATTPGNAWAVGASGISRVEDPALIERWNGKAWRVQPSLNVGVLLGVAATSPTNAWAVGDYYNGIQDRTLALHCC